MNEPPPEPVVDPETVLREVGAALRWAAWGGAGQVERVEAPPAAVETTASAGPAHSPRSAPRQVPPPSQQPSSPPPPQTAASAQGKAERLAALRARIGPCERCHLHGARRHIVHGQGDPDARLFIIGAGPGDDEDGAGAPFVGEDGALLDRMLAAMGLSRDAVFLSGLVRCRGERDHAALAACTPFLRTELQIVQPEVVLLFGETPARFLLKSQGVAAARGQWRTLVGVPTLATWGLATMRQQPGRKRDAWQDLQAVMARLGLRR